MGKSTEIYGIFHDDVRKFSFEKWKPSSQSNAQICGSWELGPLFVWHENMRYLPDPELPAGSWELGENPYRMHLRFAPLKNTFVPTLNSQLPASSM
jgi:hypothetical protein